jgi:hypothetical protein
MLLILYHEKLLNDNTFLNLSKVSFDKSDTFSLLKWFYEKIIERYIPKHFNCFTIIVNYPSHQLFSQKSIFKVNKNKKYI